MDNGNRGRNKNKSGSRDSLRDFYYANTYPEDSNKARVMGGNVENDLKPFDGYIKASINQKNRSTAAGAKVSIVEEGGKEKSLEPKFTLIKPRLLGPVLEVKKPLNIYQVIVDAEDGDFDPKSFEVFQRGEPICTYKEKVDIPNGLVLVRLEGFEAKQGIKYDLYDNDTHEEESIKCRIEAINFSDLDTDCFEGFDAKIEHIEDSGDSLRIHVDTIPHGLELISLLGETLPVIKKISSQEMSLSAKGYSILPQGEFYVVTPEISDKIEIYSGTNLISYEKIDIFQWTDKEIQELLQTKEVSIKNERLVYTGEEEGEVTFLEKYTFNLKTEKLQLKKRLKDKQGKSIGTIIEVITDSMSIGDLESNVDVFFKENIDTLTDSLPYRKGNREFKIGWRDENQNLLEIAELVNGRLEKIGSDNLPERLYAKPDDWQLSMQKSAILKLKEMPCFFQQKLLELFERKTKGREKGCVWEKFSPKSVSKWYILTDESYDGCQEQREFVQKALATKDFGFLDGPPGSGKTTVLLELVAQLVMDGKKILLTASTNAAVDNILERLEKLPKEVYEKILAVRLGNENVISETVEKYSLSKINDADMEKEIVCRANLVCGTIFGVLKHPEFNLKKKNQPVRPLYDYLIVDEASKTTFQDFLIPALYSKHWILSGDLKQLTPYVEQETIQSSLEEMPEFDNNWQRVQTILQLAKDNRIGEKSLSFYIVVSQKQIVAAKKLLTEEWSQDKIGIITSEANKDSYAVSFQEIKDASSKAVILYGAKLLIIEDKIFKEVQLILPSHYTPMFDVESDSLYKSPSLVASVEYYFSSKKNIQVELGVGKEKKVYKEWKDIADYWSKALKDKSWAGEITWRLCRLQELTFDGAERKTVENLKKQIEERLPSDSGKKEDVKQYCNAISGIALPSVLQLLQQGLDTEVIENKKSTTLNSGFNKEDFDCRHTMLTYQHRMHPVISKFSRENIYRGEALLDGSEMEGNRQWNCEVFGKNAAIWIDTKDTHEHRNENRNEVSIIYEQLKEFMTWTKANPNKEEKNRCWSVACLTYYKKQERLLKQKIRSLFSDQREKSWYHDKDKHIEVFIYTVDKFQGREADVVFLSLIKSGKANLGFMDSPNRLNVALTRARYQRVIVGSRSYFKRTEKSKLLRELAEQEESK